MQTVQAAVDSALSSASTKQSPIASVASETKTSTTTNVQQAVVDRFWIRMAELFGHAWVSQYGATPSPDTAWAIALRGLTIEQIRHGINETALLPRDFPPSVGRFRALCLDIPTLEKVRAWMRTGEDRNRNGISWGFAHCVLQNIDGFRYRTAPAEFADRMIRDAYELAADHVMRGGALQAQPLASIAAEPEPDRKPIDPEKGKVHIAAIDAILGEGT